MKRRNLFKAIGALFVVPFFPKLKKEEVGEIVRRSDGTGHLYSLEKHGLNTVYFYATDASFRYGDYVGPRTARNNMVRVTAVVPRERWMVWGIPGDKPIVAMYQGESSNGAFAEGFLQETDWIKLFSATGDASSKRRTFIAVNHINHDNI